MAITLKVEKRELKTDVAALRAAGKIPAVFYGKKEQSTPISIATVDFVKAYRSAGESTVVILKGEGIEVESLIHDMDLHPVTGKPMHADFYVFEKGKKIKVDVPLDFVGVAPAIKELGGSLIKVLHTIEIEALPKDLPHKISVDIASLVDFKSSIKAGDIKLPEGVALSMNAEDIVASAAEAKAEEEEVVAPVDLDAIEVEKKGKEAKEGAEGAEGAAAPAADAKADKKEAKK